MSARANDRRSAPAIAVRATSSAPTKVACTTCPSCVRITIRLPAVRFARRLQSAFEVASAADWLVAKAFAAASIDVRNGDSPSPLSAFSRTGGACRDQDDNQHRGQSGAHLHSSSIGNAKSSRASARQSRPDPPARSRHASYETITALRTPYLHCRVALSCFGAVVGFDCPVFGLAGPVFGHFAPSWRYAAVVGLILPVSELFCRCQCFWRRGSRDIR